MDFLLNLEFKVLSPEYTGIHIHMASPLPLLSEGEFLLSASRPAPRAEIRPLGKEP